MRYRTSQAMPLAVGKTGCRGLGASVVLALILAAASAPGQTTSPAGTVFDSPVNADSLPPPLVRLADSLASRTVVRARFEQHRSLQALTKPVVSAGSLLFDAQHGIVWRIETPFADTIVLSRDEAGRLPADRSHAGDGRSRGDMAARFVGAITDAFRGDIASLDRVFAVYFRAEARGRWTMGLVPRKRVIARVVDRIVLTGTTEDFVTTFELLERSGDRTTVTFRPEPAGMQSLTAQERHTLGLR